MRIAFLTSLFMPYLGGAEIFLHHLVSDMSRRGHHVAVIAPGSRKHRDAFEVTYPHIRALRARSKRFLVGNALPSLMAAHWRHHFDLVHCQGEYHETRAAYYFQKISGVPYVCRPIGGGFTNVEGRPKLQAKLFKTLTGAELVFAQGGFLKQRILDAGIPEAKIVTIHNGVRAEEIRPHKIASPVIVPPYLLYAGGLKRVKGYDIALKAFARVAGSHPELKLVIMGIDQLRSEYEALLSSLNLNNRVIYLKWCDRPTTANLFCHATIYLCPFHRSPFSNANLEALAAGVPIIATAVEGNLEQIENGVEGFLVPPKDVDAMAEKIELILSDADMHRNLARNALRRSRQFEWQKMVDRYERCYHNVLAL
jgi:glycosyltransferase involved in cell wall biosynthesis